MVLFAVTLAALVDPLAFERQPGPFATLEAACGETCEFKNRTDDSAFFQRQGDWYVALRESDGWYRARLPLQDGVAPGRVTDENGVHRVAFSQHAFGPSLDVDADWVWPCAAGACSVEAVPISLQDHNREITIESQLITQRGNLDVVFTKLKLAGAADWREKIVRLRGSHSFAPP